MNNPINNTNALIKREWIEACFDETLSYKELQQYAMDGEEFDAKYQGVDFAFSDRITADRSAFVSIGKVGESYYVFDCQTAKGLSVNEQLNMIKDVHHAKYRYDQIGLEENSIKAISKDISKFNLPITLFWTSSSDPSKSRTDYKDYDYLGKRHTVGKINLIMRLGTAFENGQFVLPYKTEQDKKISDEILAECISYALSDGKLVEASVHPDIPIGLGYALELINNMKHVYFDYGEEVEDDN